ncbi:MAG: tryptophan 7-halogenase, partial [Deltaproteobacteria bacterium]|nr:tryptophan 7-halogenase [Deltaproteobacteria bacterium]
MFDYDVVILGSGYGGSLTALVARALGQRVLLVEASDHPRFAIGESTTPEQNLRLKYLARRYDLPLLEQLSSYPRILQSNLPVATWPKCSFYYVHHGAGRPIDKRHPPEILMQTSPWPTGPDCHVYRADYDLLLKDEAVARGAEYLPHTKCTAVSFSAQEGARVELQSDGGQARMVRARLLVDGTGGRSVLARELGLALEDSADVPMFSASVFAHFKGLKSWEGQFGRRRLPFSRDHATMHHYSRDGWFWVIPFDNDVTSVGWVSKAPLDESISAEQNFYDALKRMPSFAAVFENAEAVTPFYRLPRLQYSTRQMTGDAWAMLPHAAEFVDPWLSSGMVLTTAAVARLGAAIEAAPTDQPIDATHLALLERQFREEAAHVRKIVDGCLRSLHDPRLLQRALAVYRLAVMLDGLALSRNDGDSATASVWAAHRPDLKPLVDRAYEFVCGTDPTRPATDNELARLDAILRKNDPVGFFRTRMGRLREDGIYIVSAWRMLDLLAR